MTYIKFFLGGFTFWTVFFTLTYITWKVSVFGVFLVRTFPYLDWIRRDTPYLSVISPNAGKYGPEKLQIRALLTQCLLCVSPFILWFVSITNCRCVFFMCHFLFYDKKVVSENDSKIPLHKICENTGFHWPVFSHIRSESLILSLYERIRVSENMYFRIYYAVIPFWVFYWWSTCIICTYALSDKIKLLLKTNNQNSILRIVRILLL